MSCNCHRNQNTPAYSVPVGTYDQPAKSQGRSSLMNPESNKGKLTGSLTFNKVHPEEDASDGLAHRNGISHPRPHPPGRGACECPGFRWANAQPHSAPFPWCHLARAPGWDQFHSTARMARLAPDPQSRFQK